MNMEEIEELKEFTIDLTDIDELALGLEVCSKKSNMVIQEFIDTIVQLQQENQELKKQLEEYREQVNKGLYNTCLPYTTGYNKAIKDKENQQKEFIEWLTNEANINPYDVSDYVYEDIINTILSKYKEVEGNNIESER